MDTDGYPTLSSEDDYEAKEQNEAVATFAGGIVLCFLLVVAGLLLYVVGNTGYQLFHGASFTIAVKTMWSHLYGFIRVGLYIIVGSIVLILGAAALD